MGDQNTGRYQPTADEHEEALKEIERLSAELAAEKAEAIRIDHHVAEQDRKLSALRDQLGMIQCPGLVVEDRAFFHLDGKIIPTVLLSFAPDDWMTRDQFVEAMGGKRK